MKVSINFAEVEERPPGLPLGTYEGVVEVAEVKESQSSEYPYINFKLSVTEGEHEGESAYTIRSFHPKALGMMKETMATFGFDVSGSVEFEIDDATGMLLTPDLVGEPCKFAMVKDVYEGKVRTKVGNFMGLKGVKSVDPASVPSNDGSTPANPFAKVGTGAKTTGKRTFK